MPYIEQNDPRWNDPFNRFQFSMTYKWECLKNGEKVAEGYRVVKMDNPMGDALIAQWNAQPKNPTYEWRYTKQ